MALKTSNKNRRPSKPTIVINTQTLESADPMVVEPPRDNRVHVPRLDLPQRSTLTLKHFGMATVAVVIGVVVLLIL